MADFTLKRNDLEPDLRLTLTDNGVPWPLTNVAAVRLILVKQGVGVPKVDAAMVPDADQVENPGVVTYEWAAGDTDTEGLYDGEVEVELTNGDLATFPNGHDGDDYFTVEIRPDLD